MTVYDKIDLDMTKHEGHERELIPRGATIGVCVDVIDEGWKPNDFKKDEKTGASVMQRRVRIVWETARQRKDGRRFTISKSYNAKIYDGHAGGNASTLYNDLSSWIGDGWDGRFTSGLVMGRTAELFIEHEKGKHDKSTIYPKVLAVHPLETGEIKPAGTYKRYVPPPAPTQPKSAPADYDEEIGF